MEVSNTLAYCEVAAIEQNTLKMLTIIGIPRFTFT